MTPAAVKAAAVAVVVAAVGLLWSALGPAAAPPQTALEIPPTLPAVTSATPPAPSPPASRPAPIARAAEIPSAAAVPLGSHEVPDLHADAQGRLVVDARTRDALEKLIALNDRTTAPALLQRLEAVLGPAAYRQAVDAFYAYQNYSIAAAQLASPAQPVTDEAGALRQLDALHALRVQQFGAAVAQAYFGDEEATARRLIAEMRAQPANGSTLAERADLAQRALAPTR